MNIPFSRKIIKSLPIGFTHSCRAIGRDDKGNDTFYPNRKQRRAIKQKAFKRPQLPIERKQHVLVHDKDTGKMKVKTIFHYRTISKPQ